MKIRVLVLSFLALRRGVLSITNAEKRKKEFKRKIILSTFSKLVNSTISTSRNVQITSF